MMKKLLILPLAVAVCACGSDDNDSKPIITDPKPSYQNFDLAVDTNESFNGEMMVYLGRYRPCDTYPQYCGENNKNQMTPDDSKYIIKIRAADLKQAYPTSINSGLFADGHYSVLDILRYVGDIREDIQFELGQFNDQIGTYDFRVSWDRNGDGQFDELDNIDGESNLNSKDWYARYTYTAGEFMRESGQPTLEVLYDRLDEFIVRDNLELRFESFSPAMTERRQLVQAKQVERLSQSNMVVPEVIVDFLDGAGLVTVAKDIAVKPYDIRSDLFKPGSYTAMDILMSAHDSGQAEIGYSFWPTLSTNANVGSYAVHVVNGQRTQGFSGWTLSVGEKETFSDFFNPGPLRKGSGVVNNIIAAGDKYCAWLTDDGKHTADSANICFEEWGNSFGGGHIHHMTDAWVTTYPPGAVKLVWQTKQWDLWNATEQNIAGDGQFPVYDIEQAIAPLDDNHFGWKVADCGMCHSLDKIHLEGDSPALPDQAEPYFCASCHGSNGATAGHGETSRCFWCHSKDVAMVNHGDASMIRLIGDVACVERATDTVDDSRKGACATQDNLPLVAPGLPILIPHDIAGNFQSKHADVKYSTELTTLGNSDWHTSQTFPDPYSCVTCHVNK